MKKKSELKQLLLLVCMMAVAFIFLVPIIWMVSASFQGQGQIFKVPFNWIPREASLKNYSFAIDVYKRQAAHRMTLKDGIPELLFSYHFLLSLL